MEHCRLGSAQFLVSRIGFGCAPLGGYDYGPVDDAVSLRSLAEALESGITLFDTADVYGLGRSEYVLGRALRGRRECAVIATKGGVAFTDAGQTRRDITPVYLRTAIDASLQRLGVDWIDLYQLHWPDGRTPVTDAVGEIARAVEAGKVRAIGLCNFSADDVAAARSVHDVVSLQVPRSVLEDDWRTTIERCAADLDVPAICYNALAQGLFTGKYDARSRFQGTDLRARSALFEGERLARGLAILERLHDVARDLDALPAQVALRWLLDQPGVAVALSGIKSPDQARQNAAAASLRLTDAHRRHLMEVE